MKIISDENALLKLGDLTQVLPIILCEREVDLHMKNMCRCLIKGGAVNFVCFGKNSEIIHDFIDDELLDKNIDGITTWHVDETEKDVISFINILPEFSKCCKILITPPEMDTSLVTCVSRFQSEDFCSNERES